MENNEKLDWKPEVGKTAWAMMGNGCQEVSISKVGKETAWIGLNNGKDGRFCPLELLHPTPEAALASIKIYDLEGKEVVIPRADGIPVHFVGVCGDCSKQMVLSDEEDNAFQRVVRMAYSLPIEGGGAANGGKSDQREGGC